MPNFLSQEDVQRYGLGGDPNFSAKRNQEIIAETIRETEENYRRRMKLIDEGLAERAELVTYYIKHLIDHDDNKSFDDYAGKATLRKLWGQSRIEDLQNRARKAGFNIDL